MRITGQAASLTALVAIIAFGLQGCAQLNSIAALRSLGINKKTYREATPQNPAVEILALWQPAEGAGANGLPTRGLAGQVMFFTRGSETPVKVNGEVQIYLFDDVGTKEEQSKPIHSTKIGPDLWNMHLQDSLLGPSYQVFLPYVRRDPHRVNCTLSVKFTAPNSPTLYSKLVTVTLPGPQRTDAEKVDDGSTKGDAIRNAADVHLRNEFSKFVNKKPQAEGEASSAQEASSMAHLREMIHAAAAEDAKARNSDGDRVRQAEQQLSQLLAQQGQAVTKPQAAPEPKATSAQESATRFRLNTGRAADQANTPAESEAVVQASATRKPHLLDEDDAPAETFASAEFAELPADSANGADAEASDSIDGTGRTDTSHVRPVDKSDTWQSN